MINLDLPGSQQRTIGRPVDALHIVDAAVEVHTPLVRVAVDRADAGEVLERGDDVVPVLDAPHVRPGHRRHLVRRPAEHAGAHHAIAVGDALHVNHGGHVHVDAQVVELLAVLQATLVDVVRVVARPHLLGRG
jgi:hypothetical protein